MLAAADEAAGVSPQDAGGSSPEVAAPLTVVDGGPVEIPMPRFGVLHLSLA